MAKRRDIQLFSIAFLDLLSGALGAVIILFIAIPKARLEKENKKITNSTIESKNIKGSKQSIIKKNKTLQDKISGLLDQVRELEVENNALKVTKKNLDKKISSLEKENQKSNPSENDIGFKFKGKNIVLLIDVSGSMNTEDRIGQVKAGLKMLITSMGDEFNIDVIHFPNRHYSLYRPLWKSLMGMNQYNKEDIYNFLHQLRPYGPTPTREALVYALENYPKATDIVLLSDGAPTVGRTRKKDNIEEIIKVVKEKNYNDVQINTIGVGSDFLTNTQNDKYVFLENLASQNKGFFVGF